VARTVGRAPKVGDVNHVQRDAFRVRLGKLLTRETTEAPDDFDAALTKIDRIAARLFTPPRLASDVEMKRLDVLWAVNRAVQEWRFANINAKSLQQNPFLISWSRQRRPTEAASRFDSYAAEFAGYMHHDLALIDVRFAGLKLEYVEELIAAVPQTNGSSKHPYGDLGTKPTGTLTDRRLYPKTRTIASKLSLACNAFGDGERDSDANRRIVNLTKRAGAVDRVSTSYDTAWRKRRSTAL